MNAPFLLENSKITAEFPPDVVARAHELLKKLPGGVGAYQDSRGSPAIRQEIADFLQQRDGYPANPEVIHWELSFVASLRQDSIRCCR